ncbi:MAG: DUF4349 domain-containing protein [Bacteroidota bacterium]
MKNLLVILFCFTISMVVLSSCSQSYQPIPSDQGFELNGSERGGVFESESQIKNRKIIPSANLTLVVENVDTVNAAIMKIAEKYEGYINRSGTTEALIRVKGAKMNEAITEISKLGRVVYKNLAGEDVTERYLDFQIRLENAEQARKRYLELLAKAEDVKAALLVEKELERINETIDLFKGKLKRIEHLSEYATISVTLKEKKKPGVLGYIGLGLYHAVKWLFVRN